MRHGAVLAVWVLIGLARRVRLAGCSVPGLVAAHLVTRSGPRWITPAGHALVLDGGYRAGLGQTLVDTSAPLFGWRDQPEVRTAMDERHNTFVAVAERTVLVGYEALVAAVAVAP